jgi:hypothetical protein
MRTSLLAPLAALGLALAPAQPAAAQYAYYDANAPFGPTVAPPPAAGAGAAPAVLVYVRVVAGTRVYGPGGYYAYPAMYRGNNPTGFPAYVMPRPITAYRHTRRVP